MMEDVEQADIHDRYVHDRSSRLKPSSATSIHSDEHHPLELELIANEIIQIIVSNDRDFVQDSHPYE